jgi:hypothetical protein
METEYQKKIIALLEKISENQDLQLKRQLQTMDMQESHMAQVRPLTANARVVQKYAIYFLPLGLIILGVLAFKVLTAG